MKLLVVFQRQSICNIRQLPCYLCRPEFFKNLPKLRYVFFDDYNFLRVNPDKSLLKRDEYLLSVKKDCVTGEVVPDHEL